MNGDEALSEKADFLVKGGYRITQDVLSNFLGISDTDLLIGYLDKLGYGKIKQLEKLIKLDGAYRDHKAWMLVENDFLMAKYRTIELPELASLFGRSEGGVFAELRRLEEEGKPIDKERMGYFRRRIKQSEKALTERKIERLRKNYKNQSIEELGKMIGYDQWETIMELRRQAKMQPDEWNAGRIDALGAGLLKKYDESPVRKGGRWLQMDMAVLENIYRRKSYLELAQIFRSKSLDVLEKLRKLYEEDPELWNEERIAELEAEASRADSEILSH